MNTDYRILTKVYIVEDSPCIRHYLIELIGDIDGVCIVGEADTPSLAISGILETQPDCVILDYQLIQGTGVEVLRTIRPLKPNIAFVVITNHADPQYRRVCIEAGVCGIFDKSTEFEKMKALVKKLAFSP
jgi:DNA-binding NarL/FixJ family response regulator